MEQWINLRNGLKRHIDLMEAGSLRTFAGRALETETTEHSLEIARTSLAAVDQLLAHDRARAA